MTQQINPPTPPYGPPDGPGGAAAPAPPTRAASIPTPAAPYGQRPAPPGAPYGQPPSGPPPVPPPPAAFGQPQAAPPQPGPYAQPPAAPSQPGPYGQPSFGPSQPYGQPPAAPPPVGFGYPAGGPPKKKRTGLIVGIIVGVLVLAGLGVGAFILLSPSYLNTGEVQSQVTSYLKTQTGVSPTDVQCPSNIEAKSGSTFKCSASLEGQPVTLTIKQTNDSGHIQGTVDNNIASVDKINQAVAQQVSQKIGIDVTADCDAGGKHVLVDQQNKPITCTVTNKDDSTDSAQVTATYDDQDNVSVQFPNQ